ncbi:MAG: helix-turn-helix domain-containing protein [Clostridia bacterium]|nr:helix-turn-helix domain-containing protein [Clostridia bacterium]
MSQQQLADKMEIARSTISMWETGASQPDNDALLLLSEILDAPVELMIYKIVPWTREQYESFSSLTNDNDKFSFIKEWGIPHDLAEYYYGLCSKQKNQKTRKIKVLGYVRAGIPVSAVEEILGYEEIPESLAKTGDYFALKIKGDSMEPKFSEGDIIIVRQQQTAESGDIVVALINGDDATVKKINITSSGIILQPLNPLYKAMYYSPRDVQELPVSIIGKVVELRARF